MNRRSLLLGLGASLALPACSAHPDAQPPRNGGGTPEALRLIGAARTQIGVTTRYDGLYTALRFPNGDVPRVLGACTDVIVRAYRDAFGIDLQALVNRDMLGHFAVYPQRWGLSRPDPNIDHRRVPNLATWFTRQGAALPVPRDAAGWRAGDIFTSLVDNRGPHIGFVSERIGPDGRWSSTISAQARARRMRSATGRSPGAIAGESAERRRPALRAAFAVARRAAWSPAIPAPK
jgi:uncharacterized protein